MHHGSLRGTLRPGLVLLPVMLACGFALSGCGPSDDDDPPLVEEESPTLVIERFASVQSDPQRDLTEYARCLHPTYRFYFINPKAKGLPPSWSLEEDVAATQRMFDTARSISMCIHIENPEGIDAGALTPPPPSMHTFKVTVNLAVTVPRETEPDVVYQAEGYADITVKPDPANYARWVISSIVDRTSDLNEARPRVSARVRRTPTLEDA